MRTVFKIGELKQTLNLLYGGKRVAACVREVAVNDEMVTGNPYSYCYFVLLKRAYK